MLALAVSAFLATGAAAQVALPTEFFGLSFSIECQTAVLGAVAAPDFAACFPLADVLPALTSNDSIAPYLDNFMSNLCYEQPCSQQTLDTAAQAVIAGCSSDLQKDGLSDSVITTAFNQYPLVREILCTKTSEPYTEESYGGFLGPAPVAIDSGVYNSTDGYFCVTSFLTQLSAYFGTDLSVPYITAAASGQNSTAVDLLTSIQPNIICNDCIFATIDLINEAYPAAGDISFDAVFGALNMTSPFPAGTTVNSFANETCAYNDQAVTTDGTLPETITVSIVNSTFSP